MSSDPSREGVVGTVICHSGQACSLFPPSYDYVIVRAPSMKHATPANGAKLSAVSMFQIVLLLVAKSFYVETIPIVNLLVTAG